MFIYSLMRDMRAALLPSAWKKSMLPPRVTPDSNAAPSRSNRVDCSPCTVPANTHTYTVTTHVKTQGWLQNALEVSAKDEINGSDRTQMLKMSECIRCFEEYGLATDQ